MIKRSLRPGQKLAVGKQEYKDIIEASLRIHCLFDEAVLEVIWGLKNLIKFFVPGEELELTHEDRLQISRGMKMVLDRYGIEVDASLVNSGIIDMASTVYECDLFVDERAELLQYGSNQIKEVSRIETGLWDKLELATALKLICYPEDEIVTGFSDKMLTKFVAEKLVADAHLYELKRHDWIYMDLYTDFVWVYGVRHRALELLGSRGKTRFEVAPGVHLQDGRTRFGAPALTAVHGRKIEGAPGV
ncbi:uncharacterized protein [Lolium perenne]|uniref:uncharacterized protein n=1 Tax=Lolium perenne TaxID=4522 RepID=UPI003A99B4FF